MRLNCFVQEHKTVSFTGDNPTCSLCVFLHALGELKLHDIVNSTFVKSCDFYNVISTYTLTVF